MGEWKTVMTVSEGSVQSMQVWGGGSQGGGSSSVASEIKGLHSGVLQSETSVSGAYVSAS